MIKSFDLSTSAVKGNAVCFDGTKVNVSGGTFAGIISASLSADTGVYKAGDTVPVTVLGVATALCEGSAAAGDSASVTAEGLVKKAEAGDACIGIFLGDAVDGDYVEVLIDRSGVQVA